MNGDEVVRKSTLYPFCSICIPNSGMCKQALPIWILVTFDVRFALLTVNESRRVYSNYEFLSEILNMY
jgi:bifunctional DNase/RNase